ncbi:MAG: tRNA preQ1(34) S-adenosylmethionine ribosyltransferase-isomerase QueA [Atopobiaceae bacterium]|jgi:S-adenosylmethionine:tRNA ribosyltransferase-isomerase|nr:tRNA preQ1(34) S-adenosylmethionine ribosyltransferase-isomerase QueA [Atopobiaceae bacterium]MCH4181001.1 tRNA preQ1(34) S-adenosylmethionine ribosyltransferase-isomerase QueA [Atopobiaceae bacterium]MCH4214913.1 tRNA preQ1(34) S-adenosylmethionine ribosyltransferase-isomerase QueA [Atopobiaceae bacterium]MCH4229759.1 tRNA preQ1(34) S-adenosylmethionine ribosyltransferase-isomerase QueA [Atopobiaceae bacterium]MCH4276044.1 tRNA preQ1(34) S-adenosylmethionine ribosyltransferase-isomerase Que
MRTDDFDYDLPDELIAQAPADPRDSCRLLVLHRSDGSVDHRHFTDILDYLEPGDLLVANKTRVMPARLVGHKAVTGGVAETLLLKRREDLDAMGHVWECLVNPGKRLKPGATVEYRAGGAHAPMTAPVVLTGHVEDFVDDSKGGRVVRFEPAEGLTLDAAMHEAGHVPLPPYITKYEGDPEKYQTVYAMHDEHSAAAPTAGLHFTPELIDRVREHGVGWATVELEVGIDTFRLVEEDDPTAHVMHTERYHVGPDVVDAVHATKAAGHRVIAVGTTSVRSLESAWDAAAPVADPAVVARRFEDAPDSAKVTGSGDIVVRRDATTNLYLMPGSTYHVVDALITNFHVPRSTLMMLVSALATREQIMAAYHEAISERYRMLSFGDAMFIE